MASCQALKDTLAKQLIFWDSRAIMSRYNWNASLGASAKVEKCEYYYYNNNLDKWVGIL